MLIEFSVKNFLSFKDKTTLFMNANSGNENSQNYVESTYLNLLKSVAIYGSNASGKTNLLKALKCAITIIKNSHLIPENGVWIDVEPFLFDKTTASQPSEFEFKVLLNGIKYRYFFKMDKENVYDEFLEAYYTRKPTLIFKRSCIDKYEFNTDKKILEDIAFKNTKNKLFLSTATVWNYSKTKDIFDWFSKKIYFLGSYIPVPKDYLFGFMEENSSLKSFALKILNEADIGIKDISVSARKIELNGQLNHLENIGSFYNSSKETLFKVEFEHETINEDGVINTFSLNLNKESDGTKTLFTFIPYLKEALESECLLIVDELEKSLHPMLVEYITKLFNNNNLNIYGSQMIFTTHLTNLMNIELFRRDQIWFVEKDVKTGSSNLYSLDSFSIRKDENIYKGYLSGRYGAVPYIKEEVTW